MTAGELRQRIHLINNDIRIMKSDVQRITHESRGQRDRIRDNQEKVKLNKQLPYLVANVVEILEPDAEDGMYYLLSYMRVLFIFETVFRCAALL
jgi:26S proteasome regulatory subunit T5